MANAAPILSAPDFLARAREHARARRSVTFVNFGHLDTRRPQFGPGGAFCCPTAPDLWLVLPDAPAPRVAACHPCAADRGLLDFKGRLVSEMEKVVQLVKAWTL